MSLNTAFKSIALVKEIESPENPGGLEKRVALIPTDVGKLSQQGIQVFVEYGAGEGVGFSDKEYLANNAVMQTAEQIYLEKELIIKFKGPSLESIKQMKKGCTLFCMAHFNSYPDRAKLLQDMNINVIAMEEIAESPKIQTNEVICARQAMVAALNPFFANNTIGGLRVRVIGWSERLRGAIRRCGNRNPRSLHIIQPDTPFHDLDAIGNNTLYFYDSSSFKDDKNIISQLKDKNTHVFDLFEFEKTQGSKSVMDYQNSHPPAKLGLRRIQCLHETGRAGARFGIKLLSENKPDKKKSSIRAIVLGYGNVAQGAIDELHGQGVNQISVLGRTHTSKGHIDFWLKGVDLVINGAEQSPQMRGVNFLISNQHLQDLIPNQSVIIDLVGGSPTNRSPVEAVISCSFLTAPSFVQDGVTISSLWGWPMLGMMKETAIKYSGQIVEVLTGTERLIDGLDNLSPGVQRALVCGPFQI